MNLFRKKALKFPKNRTNFAKVFAVIFDFLILEFKISKKTLKEINKN